MTQSDLSAWYAIGSSEHFWFDWRFHAFESLLKDLSIDLKGKKLLEVGCGAGVLLEQIEKALGAVVEGVDPNETAPCSPAVKNKIRRYDIAEKSRDLIDRYEGVVLFDVLEHILDRRTFLKDCGFHIRTGGYLFVNVPAGEKLYSEYDRAAGHHVRYLPNTLKKELENAGFEVTEMRYWGLALVPVAWARKAILNFSRRSRDEVLTLGFKPPGQLANQMLSALGKLERTLAKNPFIGTSLLAVASKRKPEEPE